MTRGAAVERYMHHSTKAMSAELIRSLSLVGSMERDGGIVIQKFGNTLPMVYAVIMPCVCIQ